MMKQKQILGLIGWLILCYLVAGIGGVASINAGSFYAELVRPQWAPPGSVFGPVWTILYTLMAIAAWLVWRDKGFRFARPALVSFLVQLAVNGLWSWLFFAWQLGALSFADILLLLVLINVTIVSFWRIKPLAAMLLVPYLLWVSFAAVLNYSIWQLNPQLLG
jgi:benzodiazapine receptor